MSESLHTPMLVQRGIIMNAEDELLISQRALSSRHDAGLYEFPGGQIEPGDPHSIAALSRELQQENGIEAVIDPNYVLHRDHVIFPDNGQVRLTEFRVGFALGNELDNDPTEVADAAWLPWQEIRGRRLTPASRVALQKFACVMVKLCR